jgi:hypothetical protein
MPDSVCELAGPGVLLTTDCEQVSCACCQCSESEDFSEDESRGSNLEIVDEVLYPLLPESSKRALEQEGSPQRAALDWLIQEHDLDIYSDFHIIQRYALATLYFSTGGGTSWYESEGWLSPDLHACQWYSSSVDLFGENPCSGGILYELLLIENGLEGSIPEDLGLLSTLGMTVEGDLRDFEMFASLITLFSFGHRRRVDRLI